MSNLSRARYAPFAPWLGDLCPATAFAGGKAALSPASDAAGFARNFPAAAGGAHFTLQGSDRLAAPVAAEIQARLAAPR
jgi:hypothetical protein